MAASVAVVGNDHSCPDCAVCRIEVAWLTPYVNNDELGDLVSLSGSAHPPDARVYGLCMSVVKQFHRRPSFGRRLRASPCLAHRDRGRDNGGRCQLRGHSC